MARFVSLWPSSQCWRDTNLHLQSFANVLEILKQVHKTEEKEEKVNWFVASTYIM
jgi:hypothetical protein